jgi:hypothetical protein
VDQPATATAEAAFTRTGAVTEVAAGARGGTGTATAAALALDGLVDADVPAVDDGPVHRLQGGGDPTRLSEKLTKPKPRLRPVSRSLITTASTTLPKD